MAKPAPSDNGSRTVVRVRLPGTHVRTDGSGERRGGPRYGNPNGKRGKPRGTKGGRKAGVPNRATRAIREAAAASGELPHEFTLKVLRLGVGGIIEGSNKKWHELTWDDIKWAVHEAIGFFAPKMSAMKITGPNDGPIQFASLDARMLAGATPSELLVLEKFFGRLQQGIPMPALPAPNVRADDYAKTLQ